MREKDKYMHLYCLLLIHKYLCKCSLCVLCMNLNYCMQSLAFSLKNFLQYILQGVSASNKFSQFLFIWECLYFSFNSERQFSCIQDFWFVNKFFLSVLWICHTTTFWSPFLLMISQMLILLRFTMYMVNYFSYCPKFFYPCLLAFLLWCVVWNECLSH